MANRFIFDGMSFNYESKTDLEKNAEGSTFILDGKECRLEDLIIEKNGIQLGEAQYSTSNGLPAYIFYENVPAFDEFDYIYDTSRCLLIVVDDGYLTAIYISKGYKYGTVCRYENIYFEDTKTKEKMNISGVSDNMQHEKEYAIPEF